MAKGVYLHRPLSAEHRQAISRALKQRGGNAGSFRAGEHRSPTTEFRNGMVSTRLGLRGVGLHPGTNYGGGSRPGQKPAALVHDQAHTEEAKARMRIINRGKALRGDTNPNWKGGTGTVRHQAMGQWRYREWRDAVFRRDGYVCRSCGGSGYLHADHIVGWSEDAALRYDVTNGQTLCYRCHFRKTFGWFDEATALLWGVPAQYRRAS